MHKRTVGIILICISAFLYGIRYVTAAIFGSNVQGWSSELFGDLLSYVGLGPLIWSILALIAGIVYLIIAEFGSSVSQSMKDIKENWNDFDTQNDKNKDKGRDE